MRKRLAPILSFLLLALAALTATPVAQAAYPVDGSCDSYLWVLYQDDNWSGPSHDNWVTGNTCSMRDNDLRSTNDGNWNDRADSILIFHLPSNRRVYFCKDINYAGGCLQFDGPFTPSSAGGLQKLNFGGWHDAISSFYTQALAS